MARTNKAVLDNVLDRFVEAEDARRGIEEKILENYRAYRNYDPDLESRRKEDGRSGLFIPKTFSAIETAVPRIVRAVLAERPYAVAYPRSFGDGEEATLGRLRAASMQTLVDYQLAEKIQFRTLLTKAVRSMLIAGYQPAQIGWERKFRNRRVREVDPETGQITRRRKQEVFYNGPTVQLIHPLSFFWDPFAESLEDAEFVIVQTFRTNRWLHERRHIFKNVNRAIESRPGENPAWVDTVRELMGLSVSRFERMNEVIELWTRDSVQTICNKEVVLRDEEHPFDHGELPFVVAADTQMAGEFIGRGMVEPMLDLQIEKNAKRNQRMDNVNFILNKVFTILRGSDLMDEDMKLWPGKTIPVDDHDDIRELQFTDVTGSSYQEEAIIDRDIQETSGIFPYMQGASPQFSRERATTVAALQAAGDERLHLRVSLLEEQFLLPIVRQVSALNQQYLTTPEYVRVTGPEGLVWSVPITPENIQGEFEFAWSGSTVDSIAERQFKINQLIQLLGIANQSQRVNTDELIRRILQLADIKNLDQIIPPMPAIDQATQLPLDQQMAMGGAPVQVGGDLPNQDRMGAGRSMRIGPTPFETPSP